MSRYTTEVRFICENYAGNVTVDNDGVDVVINKAIPKIFNFDFPIFDEAYRLVLERKIIYHFYTREIGLETVGLWKLKLRTKLNEIMPYYNILYNILAKDFDPLKNVDVKIKRDGTDTEIKKEEGKTSNSSTHSTNSVDVEKNTDNRNITEQNQFISSGSNTQTDGRITTDDKTSKFSDTPQGGLTGLTNDKYLTSAQIDNNTHKVSGTLKDVNTKTDTNDVTKVDTNEFNGNKTNSTSGNESGSGTSQNNTDIESVQDYLEHKYGYEGVSQLDILAKLAENIYNVDLMVMNDLEELFMQIW